MAAKFMLFVTGRASHSLRAIQVARELVADPRLAQYELEVIDVLEDPGAAEKHKVLATPTLLGPDAIPVRRLLGDLTERTRVYEALGLDPEPAPQAS